MHFVFQNTELYRCQQKAAKSFSWVIILGKRQEEGKERDDICFTLIGSISLLS